MRGVVTGTPHQPAAGMTTRTAQVQTGDRRTILGGLVGGAHHKHLVQGEFPVVPMTAGNPPISLQVSGGQQFCVPDALA